MRGLWIDLYRQRFYVTEGYMVLSSDELTQITRPHIYLLNHANV